MKSKISIASFFVFIFVSSASFAQYKYDIGLKASTFDMERFQLEARFHLNNPYSIVVALANGSQNGGYSSQTPLYNDSLFDITQSGFSSNNNVLKLGVQRKLGFLASDVFYAGAVVGFGYQRRNNSFYTATYSVDSNSSASENPYLSSNWNEISSNNSSSRTSAINAQLALSFGMDVPITKRFSINAEVSFAGIYERLSGEASYYPLSFVHLQSTISGGLRYSFGKRN